MIDRWLGHIRTHCHGWHMPAVRVFAEEVAATYGAPLGKTSTAGLLAHPKRVRNVSLKTWAADPWRQQAEAV